MVKWHIHFLYLDKKKCILLIDKPSIKAIGYTVIWKQTTNKEIDEFSLFFKDKIVFSSETDNINLSLNNELNGTNLFVNYFYL